MLVKVIAYEEYEHLFVRNAITDVTVICFLRYYTFKVLILKETFLFSIPTKDFTLSMTDPA